MNLKEFVKTVDNTKTEFKRIEDFDSISSDVDIEKVPAPWDESELIFQAIIDEMKIKFPKSVVTQLKEQLEEKDFDSFKVKKTGTGMDTRYTVITL